MLTSKMGEFLLCTTNHMRNKKYVSYLYFSMIIPYNPQSPQKNNLLRPFVPFFLSIQIQKENISI
jgi:hypothetical protein